MMTSDQAAFRQRCQQALTHPVTLGAVGILLLNDLLLKGLWPNPWTTGKLSDLAWVVFAAPLLAYLLSLATPGTQWARRTVWAAAYLGLPLLYAAFNTFAPLHDAILRGLTLLSGGAGSSPLDATDSLVIPLGLAVALWVWRRGQSRLTISRQQVALAVAGLGVFASIATSYYDPNYGVVGFNTTDEGRLATYCSGSYETADGGFTWDPSSSYSGQSYYYSPEARVESVATPRGDYSINESGVMHSGDDSSPVYSTEYLRSTSARWIQEHETSHLDVREEITDRARAITYDAPSDNVVVAMGLQGVVVGTPDGEWTRVAVGPCRPTDFSFSGKVGTLLTTADFRILVLFIPIAAITLTMAIAALQVGMPAGSWGRRAIPVAATVFAAGAALDTGLLLLMFDHNAISAFDYSALMTAALVAVGFLTVLTAFALCVGAFASQGFWFCASAIAAAAVATAAVAAQVTLALIVWVNSDFNALFVKISIVAMAILTGYALQRYLTRKERTARATPPSAGIDYHPEGQ